ncbi:MAG: crossover junction endodeoxyribonuclease RuvC [Nitrospirota bacterium]
MRIIGIDPGLVATGYGIIYKEEERSLFVTAGSITTSSKDSISKRLKIIYNGIVSLIEQYKPSVLVVEDTFLARNIQTAIKLGQARGVALLAGENHNLPVYEYTPTEIKLGIVGYGGAKKEQVAYMVRAILKSNSVPDSHHAGDALAAAICHSHSMKMAELTR